MLEAQASGIPVIVTDSGGPRENMIPGKTGLVVKANDVDDLLCAAYSLLNDPRRLKEMGRMARQYMLERSFENAFNKTWQIYSEKRATTASSANTRAKAV